VAFFLCLLINFFELTLFDTDSEEENDFACAAVLTTHTQDVKQLKWHPQKDV
jgi:hypothetical protein